MVSRPKLLYMVNEPWLDMQNLENEYFGMFPKEPRSKLCLRGCLGTFLGLSASSSEVYIALNDGLVIKTRSIARVVADKRWDAEAVLGVTGTPGNHSAVRIAHAEHSHIEEHEQPHLDVDNADRQEVNVEEEKKRKRVRDLTRITARDLRLYDYHDGHCPQCAAIQRGIRSFANHSDEYL